MTRRAFLILALLALAGLWLGPLPARIPRSFSAHMALHMGVVALASPLFALGLAGARHDPVRRFPRLFSPIPWSFMELIVVWGWHAPAFHHLARHSLSGLALEQAMFFASATAVWLAAFGGDGVAERGRRGAGVAALLLTSMHMTLLGALLALPPRPLYGGAHGELGDQHLGGAIMLIFGGAVYLAGGVWLVRALLRREAA